MAAEFRHNPETAALIVGAGAGSRFGQAKAFYVWQGEPLIWWAARPFVRSPDIGQVVLVVRTEDLESARQVLQRLGPRGVVVPGGDTRSASVRRGLEALDASVRRVLVHDAARPGLSQRLLGRILATAGDAVVPCLEVHDALHRVEPDGGTHAVDRRGVLRVQTPQLFDRALLERAHAMLGDAADDAELVSQMGARVTYVPGEEENLKVTLAEDIERLGHRTHDLLVGHGYDVHRLVPDRRLVLCGVEIPAERGALGHSDADVATHALMDAILGAAGLPDIGHFFPPGDERFRDANSLHLLSEVVRLVEEQGLEVAQADITIVLEAPRVGPHRAAMREHLASALGLPVSRVAIKATTAEGLGPVGSGEAVQAWALATLRSGARDDQSPAS